MPQHPCQGTITSTLDYFLKPKMDQKWTKLDDLLPLEFTIDLKIDATEL